MTMREMIGMERYFSLLDGWQACIRSQSPDPGFSALADRWFDTVARPRAEEYGIEFWQRFGPIGVVYQMANCWYRYRMGTRGDTLVDTVGYSVIYAITSYEYVLHGIQFPEDDPVGMQEELIHRAIGLGIHDWTSVSMAMTIAYNQWRVGS